MNKRDQLLQFADRFLKYVNNTGFDREDPRTFLAPDLKTPLAYPGTQSGFDVTVALIKKLHSALTKFSLDLVAPVVDEVEGRVVYFVKSSGVQSGYIFYGISLTSREWHGVPGTGKPFDHYGFLMMKVFLLGKRNNDRLIW